MISLQLPPLECCGRVLVIQIVMISANFFGHRKPGWLLRQSPTIDMLFRRGYLVPDEPRKIMAFRTQPTITPKRLGQSRYALCCRVPWSMRNRLRRIIEKSGSPSAPCICSIILPVVGLLNSSKHAPSPECESIHRLSNSDFGLSLLKQPMTPSSTM